MAGNAQLGELMRGCCFCLPPLLLSLQGGIIVLRAPQGQSHGHRYRSLCALCTAAFVTFYKAVAYKRILLEKGSFFVLLCLFVCFVLRSLSIAWVSIDLTELTHHYCSVFFNTKILRETKPFGDLHDKKARLCWVYNLLKFGLYLQVHLVVETFGAMSPITVLWLWQVTAGLQPARSFLAVLLTFQSSWFFFFFVMLIVWSRVKAKYNTE